MSAEVVLAIDQGTSGTKAIVLDPAEGVLATAEVALRPRYVPHGGVEQDPDELLESVIGAGRRALELAGRPAGAVAIANQGETVLAWDPDDGRALSPAIVWQDRRAEEVCAELQPHRDLLASRTGLVLDPYFSAPKMTWLRRHVTREGVVSTTDAWLVNRLAGEFVTDVSTASRSLLIDIDRVDWDQELVELFGLTGEALPTIVSCDERVGSTEAFGVTMDVGGLVVDQQAALLAERCLTAGQAKCTFGTGAFVLANTGPHAVRSAAGLTSSVAWRIHGDTAYCVDGQIYTAASAVRWMTGMGWIGDASDLDVIAAEDPEGVLCVPALAGLAAPWWQPEATGTFTGITLASSPAHLVIAVLQGIAAQIAELTDVVAHDTRAPLTSLRVDGGLTQSRVLMQAVADLTQLPVELYPSPHATASGAAALALMSLQPDLSLEEAVSDWTPATVYEPRWSAARAAEFRERWREVRTSALPPDGPR